MTAEKLEKLIYNLKNDGHSRLSPVRKLAERFNTTPGRIHKAIVSLSAKGVIKTHQGRGNFFVEEKKKNKSSKYCFVGIFWMKILPHDGYTLKMIDSLHASAEKCKINLHIIDDCKPENPERWKKVLAQIEMNGVNGFILASQYASLHYEKFHEIAPTVILNDTPLNAAKIPSFLGDYFTAGFLAAEHLALRKHRKIGYLGPVKSTFKIENLQHLAGMRLAARVHNIEFLDKNIIYLMENRNISADTLANVFAQTDCTGFLARNDSTAAFACNVLTKMGHRIPNDIAVIGCGNYQRGINYPISLTTVNYKYEDICSMGMKCLKKLNSKASVTNHNLITPELIIRDST